MLHNDSKKLIIPTEQQAKYCCTCFKLLKLLLRQELKQLIKLFESVKGEVSTKEGQLLY